MTKKKDIEFIAEPPSPEEMEKLKDGFRRSGMVEKTCPCGTWFMSRSDSDLCPPCRMKAGLG